MVSKLIEVNKLSKSFGSFSAVKNVSFSVEKGEVLGFLGPNGAGKSTSMRMITGFLPATSGTATICGHDIAQNPIEARKNIGYLPEGGPLYNDMTPASFLKFICNIRGLDKNKSKERTDFVVEKLALDKVYYQTIETLSKGFKRRVALAQAIIHDPKVLILDEPTDGLDPNQKLQVHELISLMSKDKVVVISTHILEEVEAICSRAIIISNGQLLKSGTPDELAAQATSHNNVVINFAKYADAKIIDKLKSIKNVSDAIEDSSSNKVTLLPNNGKSIIADVSKHIKSNNLDVIEFYKVSGNLTEAFRNITQTSNK